MALGQVTRLPPGEKAQGREPVPAGVHARSRSAAGLKAIIKTFRIALPRMGLRRMIKAFLRVNQKSGFDCQSCAWPSPDGTRHQFEVCESK